MANKDTTRFWNVWIDGDARTNLLVGRERIENVCGRSSGSGGGKVRNRFEWDISYHGKAESEAREIARKAASVKCAKRVWIYQDDGPSEYVKGRK